MWWLCRRVLGPVRPKIGSRDLDCSYQWKVSSPPVLFGNRSWAAAAVVIPNSRPPHFFVEKTIAMEPTVRTNECTHGTNKRVCVWDVKCFGLISKLIYIFVDWSFRIVFCSFVLLFLRAKSGSVSATRRNHLFVRHWRIGLHCQGRFESGCLSSNVWGQGIPCGGCRGILSSNVGFVRIRPTWQDAGMVS